MWVVCFGVSQYVFYFSCLTANAVEIWGELLCLEPNLRVSITADHHRLLLLLGCLVFLLVHDVGVADVSVPDEQIDFVLFARVLCLPPRYCSEEDYEAGEVIFSPGDEADSFYVVTDGQVTTQPFAARNTITLRLSTMLYLRGSGRHFHWHPCCHVWPRGGAHHRIPPQSNLKIQRKT